MSASIAEREALHRTGAGQAGRVTILALSGAFTAGAGSALLDDTLQKLIGDGKRFLLLDCRQVAHFDSWGIRALVRGLTSIRKRGGDLKLLAIPFPMRQALAFTRLLSILAAYDDETTALGSFAAGPAPEPQEKAAPRAGERRRFRRVPLVTQIELLGPGTGSVGRMEDISVGGLLMATRDTFEPQTEIAFRFNLPPIPPGQPIEGHGVVAHAQSGKWMGIQFQLLSEEHWKAIAEFVRKQSEKSEDSG